MDAEAAYDAMVRDELANQQRQQASVNSDADNDDDDLLDSHAYVSGEAPVSTQPCAETSRPVSLFLYFVFSTEVLLVRGK